MSVSSVVPFEHHVEPVGDYCDPEVSDPDGGVDGEQQREEEREGVLRRAQAGDELHHRPQLVFVDTEEENYKQLLQCMALSINMVYEDGRAYILLTPFAVAG